MLLNWTRLWDELRRHNARRGRHPLSDPLEGPEWRGLLWAVPLLCRLVTFVPCRHARRVRKPKKGPVVSGLSRSSSG